MYYIIKVRFLDGNYFTVRTDSSDVLQDYLNGFTAGKDILYMEIIRFEK